MRRLSLATRVVSMLVVLFAALFTGGCLKSKLLIQVKKDGSGNIVVTRIFPRETVTMYQAQMEEMKKNMAGSEYGGSMNMAKDPFYNLKLLKKEARRYGPKVKYVKSVKYDKNGAKGSVALYSFDNIDDISVSIASAMNPEALQESFDPDMEEIEDEDEEEEKDADALAEDKDNDELEDDSDFEDMMGFNKEENSIRFKLTKGPVNSLKILLPAYGEAQKPDEKEEDEEEEDEDMPMAEFSPAGPGAMSSEMSMMMAGGNPYGFTGNESEMEMMKKIYGGMYMDFAIEVQGTDIKSNATFPVKTKKTGTYRCLLYELDFSKMIESSAGMDMMEGGMMGMGNDSPAESFGAMRNLPGIKLETKKDLVIKFK